MEVFSQKLASAVVALALASFLTGWSAPHRPQILELFRVMHVYIYIYTTSNEATTWPRYERSKDATNRAPGLTTRSKNATNGAPGIATRSKDATNGAPGLTTRSKNAPNVTRTLISFVVPPRAQAPAVRRGVLQAWHCLPRRRNRCWSVASRSARRTRPGTAAAWPWRSSRAAAFCCPNATGMKPT